MTAQATATRSDAQKRAAVFLYAPEIILIKVLTMGVIRGVLEKPRDNLKIELKHTYEALDKGLNTKGVRETRTDTGHCVFEKEEDIRVDQLLVQLWHAGYVLEDFFWQNQNNKGPVNTFQFVKTPGKHPEEGLRLPPEAKRILETLRFNHCTVWCNLRDREGGGQYRLDTINLAKGRATDEPCRWLEADGNTYRLYD